MTDLDDTIREQLEADTISDTLIEHAQQEGERLLELNSQLAPDPLYSSSKKSTRHMNRLIAKAVRVSEPRKVFRRRAVLALAALLALLLTCYASAIRSAVGNFVLSMRENSIGLSDTHDDPDKYTDFSDTPMPAYLPKDFQCMDQVCMTGVNKLFFYDSSNQEIIYCVYADSTAVELDSEDASVNIYRSGAQEICSIEKDGKLHIFWGKDPAFELIGPAHLRDELFKMVYSVDNPPDLSGAEK